MGILSRLLKTQHSQTRVDMNNSLVAQKAVARPPYREVVLPKAPASVLLLAEPATFRKMSRAKSLAASASLSEHHQKAQEKAAQTANHRLIKQSVSQTRSHMDTGLMETRKVSQNKPNLINLYKKGVTEESKVVLVSPVKKKRENSNFVEPRPTSPLSEEESDDEDGFPTSESASDQHKRVMSENIETMRDLQGKMHDLMNRLEDLPNAHLLWEPVEQPKVSKHAKEALS